MKTILSGRINIEKLSTVHSNLPNFWLIMWEIHIYKEIKILKILRERMRARESGEVNGREAVNQAAVIVY